MPNGGTNPQQPEMKTRAGDTSDFMTDVTVINVPEAAPYLSGGGHLTTQDRVSFSQARPGKHRSLAKSINIFHFK